MPDAVQKKGAKKPDPAPPPASASDKLKSYRAIRANTDKLLIAVEEDRWDDVISMLDSFEGGEVDVNCGCPCLGHRRWKGLVSRGVVTAEPKTRGQLGDVCVIHHAVIDGKLDVVRKLVETQTKHALDVNQGIFGEQITALHVAAVCGPDGICSGMVRELLQADDIDVNPITKKGDRVTPLFFAARFGHVETVRALLAHPGVLVNTTDSNGKSVLTRVVEFGYANMLSEEGQKKHMEITALLLQCGAKLIPDPAAKN